MLTTRWDAADHLDSKGAILAWLDAVFEDGDPALITAALNDVARAKRLAEYLTLSDENDSDVCNTAGTLAGRNR